MSATGGEVFEAVAEGSRRVILDLLARGPRPVGEIVTATGLSQPNASRHLRILREAGLVASRADGQRRIYELRPAGLAELIGWVAPYQALWKTSLDALERHLDAEADPDTEREDH
ncbi:MAG: helix-turn-helix transcriptional regulator [Actinobacteria bacterium]|nr:helix-turn-helix transcriptional regulator [Actinomycetota bacterium]